MLGCVFGLVLKFFSKSSKYVPEVWSALFERKFLGSAELKIFDGFTGEGVLTSEILGSLR